MSVGIQISSATGKRRSPNCDSLFPPFFLLISTSLIAWFRADEENESSSSDDEEDDRRRLSDELLGKVCSIEAEEDPVCWYLALVGFHQGCTLHVTGLFCHC